MNASTNPFPTDEEVRFMADLGRQLLANEFGLSTEGDGSAEESSYRCSLLAKCLRDAREANGWTIKYCAQTLNAKQSHLKNLEAGQIELAPQESLIRYVEFLALQEIYQQWLAANANLAAQLKLPASGELAPRPADWPEAKTFVLTPDAFHLTPETRRQLNSRLEMVKGLIAQLKKGQGGGGMAGGLFGQGASELVADPRRDPAPPAVYQFKITLRHSKPPVWRRFQVSSEISLAQLHDVIQCVMGWYNCHLHGFQVGESRFEMTHDPMGNPLETQDALDENDYRLCELGLRPKSKVDYDYDFGDDWRHQLVLEKILPRQPDFVPTCLAGARACPAEDSGGTWGYEEKLLILRDSTHPEHEEIAEWLGEHFDPEVFDPNQVNARLAGLVGAGKKRRRRKGR